MEENFEFTSSGGDDRSSHSNWEEISAYKYSVPSRPPKIRGKMIALSLCFSLIGGIAGTGATLLYTHYNREDGLLVPADTENSGSSVMLEGVRDDSVIDIVRVDTNTMMTVAEVYAANVSSTVGITTSVTTNYWGYQTTSAASGSGFILTDDGYILTNFHVIEDADTITVSFYNGESLEGKLIGYDQSNDIAVLKVDAEGLSPVILGDSDNANVGDSVIAIGNPLGELTFSLTAGVISALSREVTMSTGTTMTLIQTDCAINSGNSGGALFNLYGEVIGITNAKYSSASSAEASIDNIGFAIPVNQVRSMVQSLIEKGYIVKPYIGVSVIDVSTETQSYGLPQGAAVKQLAENGPADKAGLQVNDIITHINGSAITGSKELKRMVSQASPGDVMILTIFRQGTTVEIQLTVGEQIQSGQNG